MPQQIDESLFRQAVRILGEGGLVIAPTETFYGILCDAWSQKAVTRLLQLKGRGYGKPIPLIAGSAIIVRNVASEVPPVFRYLAREFWPGPLTLVLKAGKGFPRGITAGTGSIGIRIPAQSPALDLARFYRRPLTATSANFEGRPAQRCARELDRDLVRQVDLVIDGGWTPGMQPSTVLNLTTDPPSIIRHGALGDRVLEFLGRLPGNLGL
ncbi:MAG: threonylcarbamoyl-AMP synthase [bacterium]|nr:MAG: threonylcarbamoyl-AMP synthase [bacterium]